MAHSLKLMEIFALQVCAAPIRAAVAARVIGVGRTCFSGSPTSAMVKCGMTSEMENARPSSFRLGAIAETQTQRRAHKWI